MGLNFSVIEPAIDFLKSQRQVEIAGGSMVGRASYRYRITDAGRARAALFLETNQYVGVAPVPFEQYRQYMLGFQKTAPHSATGTACAKPSRTSSSASPCSISSDPRSTPGTRCSCTARRATARRSSRRPSESCCTARSRFRTRSKSKAAIIRFFDPVNHEPMSTAGDDRIGTRPGRASRSTAGSAASRPMVMVGGELTLDALELSYNATSGFYRAPVQAIANGGVLVIDDFGRQQVRAARSAEPLDRAARKPRRLPDAAVGPEDSSCRSRCS